MSVQPRGFGLNGKSFYTNIAKPMEVNMTFTVTPTNGLGVTSLKSNGYVRNVFMHTSTTPTSNDGYLNPNPAAGYALLQFNNNFNRYIGLTSSFVGATATSTSIDNSALTAGLVYVITIVGNASLAKWQSIGLPPGITPAVGVSFVATAVGTGSNVLTSRVQVPTSSGISAVEVVGDPNTTIASSNIATNGGAWVVVQFLGEVATIASYTPAGTVSAPVFTGAALGTHTHSIPAGTDSAGGTSGATSGGTPAGTNSAPTFTGSAGSLTGTVALGAAAPATGSVISLGFLFDGSTVTIDGL